MYPDLFSVFDNLKILLTIFDSPNELRLDWASRIILDGHQIGMIGIKQIHTVLLNEPYTKVTIYNEENIKLIFNDHYS